MDGKNTSGLHRVKISIPALDCQKVFEIRESDRFDQVEKALLAKKDIESLEQPWNYGLFCPHEYGHIEGKPPKNSKSGFAGIFINNQKTINDYLNMNMESLTFTPLKRLYDNSADPNRITKYNSRKKRMQFLELISTGNIKKVETYLKKGIDPNYCEKHAHEESTPLIEATKIKNPQTMLSILVAHHAHPSFHDNHTLTAVHHCAIHGRDDAMETLKMLGSGMDYEDSNKLTPLYLGVQKNLTRRGLNILLEAGANLNVVDKSLYTVLHHACVNDRNDLISDLVKKGADLDAQNHLGNTCLHLAAYLNKVVCMKLLLELRANPSVKNLEGKVAADLNQKSNSQKSSTDLHKNSENISGASQNHSLKNFRQNSVTDNGHDNQSLINKRAVSSENVENIDKTEINDSMKNNSNNIHPTNGFYYSNGETDKQINRNLNEKSIIIDSNLETINTQNDFCRNIESFVGNINHVNFYTSKQNGTCIQEIEIEKTLVNDKENPTELSSPKAIVIDKDIETMKLKKLEERSFKEMMTNQNDDEEPPLIPRGLITMKERVVEMNEGKEEMGFVLRGAHSEDSSIPTFHPSLLQPALQYFSFVKPASLAHKAGILTNDFLLEVNGVNVATASHHYTAELIRKAVKDKNGVKMKVATIKFPGILNETTLKTPTTSSVKFHSLNMIKEDSEDEAETNNKNDEKLENVLKNENDKEKVELSYMRQNTRPISANNQENNQHNPKPFAKQNTPIVKPNGVNVTNGDGHDKNVRILKPSSSLSSSSSSSSFSSQEITPATNSEIFPPPPTRVLLEKLLVENTKVHPKNLKSDLKKINNNDTNGKVISNTQKDSFLKKQHEENAENIVDVDKTPKNKISSIINAFNRQNSNPNNVSSEKNNDLNVLMTNGVEVKEKKESETMEKNDGSMSQWDVEDVLQWLSSMNLHKYSFKFRSESVDGAKLKSMKRNDFISLGIKDVKDRMNIERSLMKASKSPSSS